MNKDAAIHAFFNSFGLTAFPAVSVPSSGEEMPAFPYMTYSVNTDSGLESVMANASVYYRTEGWAAINAKVREIAQAIGEGSVLECDEGGIIIRKGTPWAQPMEEPSDDMVKRKLLTFNVLYATTN